MTNTQEPYILTIACDDVKGIVAAVTGFLAEHGGFINASAQFGDFSTGRFFMRTECLLGSGLTSAEEWKEKFGDTVARRFGMAWNLYPKSHKSRIVILASTAGHCLNDLLHRYHSQSLPIDIAAVISNHPDLRSMVEWHGVAYHHLPVTTGTRREQEEKIWDIIREAGAEVVVLARYMQILSPYLVSRLYGRAINIHHSFLPGFKGARPYHQAYDRGVKLIGATAHYVTDDLDEGPIIEQEVMRVDHNCKPDDLSNAGRDIESRVLARAVRFHVEHRVLINGNKTVVF